ncbi:hypothetical protein BDZ97DRAFT_1758523 [Flammula alnicola]|nr:hypothetical protein BDZ97DRAFT_1758523 [Flammula alnicola]
MALDTGEKETDSYALSSLDSFNASDDHVVQNDISELEEKIMSIDLNVSSVQRALEGIYKEKADPHIRHKLSYKSSFFRTMVESVTSRPSKNQLATLDTEITERQGDLERLLSDRQRLKADLVSRKVELARRTCMQSSMGQLPVELWAQIFLLCLPNEDFITPDSRQAPLLLCQICSAWRNVATGTPLLWSALSIRGSWRRHIWKSSLERWLKRSGNAFLYLDISIPAYMEPTFDYHIFKVIISSADRWHHLRLNLTNQLLRSMLNNHMPVLQTLEFSSTYPIASLNVQPSHVPNLKTVSLLTKALYIQSLSLPWNQLTHLSSRCWLNIGQHVDILCKCPNLQSYSMCLVHAEIPSSCLKLYYHTTYKSWK